MKTKVKTIDVNSLEWFDKVNGNSYFAGTVTINYGQDDQRTYTMPFQYGYGEHYLTEALNELTTQGELTPKDKMTALWSYCEENKIILRYNKQSGCKKRDLKVIG